MYSVTSNCEMCLHNKVCNNKMFYNNAQKRVRELNFADGDNSVIDVCHSNGIQVTVQCPHYLDTKPSFGNSITVNDYALCSDTYSNNDANVTLRG